MSEVAAAREALMQFLYRAPIGLVQTRLDGTVEMINPMSAGLLMPLSLTGDLDNIFVVLETVAPHLRAQVADFALPSGIICDAVRIPLGRASPRKSGPAVLALSLVKLDESRLMAMIADATLDVAREQSELTRQLGRAARTDALTQMPTRAAARDRIQEVLDRQPAPEAGGFAVLFMNCDRFTQINDRLGHAAGDQVMGLVADRLRSALRQRPQDGPALADSGTAARSGSDEFIVLVDHLRDPLDVHGVAHRILDSVGQPYVIGSDTVHCSVSIGIVQQHDAAEDADVLLQDARIAMTEAKQSGGSCCVVFEPVMQARAIRRGELDADLRRGVAEGELFVVYQPVVDLHQQPQRRGCAGVEALVRWQHPTRGVVPPFEFIAAAETSGLIAAIGEFVLDAACHQFVEWQRVLGSRAPRTLAVNLSRAQLSRNGFTDTVEGILRSTGMAPRQLQLEVTESLAAQDTVVQGGLRELKALGVTLALDDFGTGFSSLASLHQLPIDTVKIDRSFVTHADTSRHHSVLIKATVLVANSLGMSTVAEGIERAPQAAMVHQLGCDKGQGYFFSKPLAAADLVSWLSGANLISL